MRMAAFAVRVAARLQVICFEAHWMRFTVVATGRFSQRRAFGFGLTAASLAQRSLVNSPIRPAGLSPVWHPASPAHIRIPKSPFTEGIKGNEVRRGSETIRVAHQCADEDVRTRSSFVLRFPSAVLLRRSGIVSRQRGLARARKRWRQTSVRAPAEEGSPAHPTEHGVTRSSPPYRSSDAEV